MAPLARVDFLFVVLEARMEYVCDLVCERAVSRRWRVWAGLAANDDRLTRAIISGVIRPKMPGSTATKSASAASFCGFRLMMSP